jgi:5-methylcytosine-specific restriction protein A
MSDSKTNNLWTREELKASVEAYLHIRKHQYSNDRVNKAAVYRDLSERFNRTTKAFEYRMQNISYVLSLMGREWIDGLKPAENVGPTNGAIIEELINEAEGSAHAPVVAFETQVRSIRNKKPNILPIGNKAPSKTTSPATQFKRDPAVVAWILEEANGVCECCKKPAPFIKDDETPFLEVHHIKRLADEGPDVVSNAAALCPNCHRELHYGQDRVSLQKRLYSTVKRLIRIEL